MAAGEMEKIFNRSILFSFTKKKGALVFPILVLCGILIVFCRAIAYQSSGWIAMSMTFLPIFLSSGILLALGVFLIRIYYHEVKNLKMDYKRILSTSWDLLVGTSYISLPIIIVYLLLWVVFGIFLLLKEIPGIGPVIGVFLSFAPYLIILSSLVLALFTIALLFYVTPRVGLAQTKRRFKIKEFYTSMHKHLFSHLVHLLVALIPILFIVGLLTLAAVITDISYVVDNHILSIALKWFFIMLPFCAFLTPAVVFFFNFAAESYNKLKN